MKGMRPMATACALVMLLGVATLAYARIVGSPQPSHYSQKRTPVTITGNVESLNPGTPAILVVRAHNNTQRKLIMRGLSLRIADASAACPGTMIQTEVLRRRNSLPPRRTRTIPVTVTLSAETPDACQAETFPIRFRARATPAS
jgi:hypothetical protein